MPRPEKARAATKANDDRMNRIYRMDSVVGQQL
jgi:hypothetical protein